MKKMLRYIAAALLLTACTADMVDSIGQGGDGGSTADRQSDSTISFSVYTLRPTGGQTRAGVAGDLTNDSLRNENVKPAGTSQTWHNKAGFGVFAYYTGDEYFQPVSQPTFMYNQQVVWSQPAGEADKRWCYAPLKYWPNNFAQAAAPSDDHVSFFAYAPYVEVDKQTGQIKNTRGAASGDINNLDADGNNPDGITGIPYMGATGDPLIDYVVSTDLSRRVDLCWGTAKENTQWGPSGSKVSVKAGMPWLNLTRAETVDSKVQFNFRHATAKLNVQIDAPTDMSVAPDANTRIFVREVSFTGFQLRGALNLNNIVSATPNWTGYQGAGWLSHDRITIYDGRADGREGTLANNSETPVGLNPSIVQHSIWDDPTDPSLGVTEKTVNLFTPSGNFLPTTLEAGKTSAADYLHLEPAYVIPTGDPLSVEIVYDVETKAPLAGTLSDGRTAGLSTCTHILRENLLPSLEAGKAYVVRLHLGLNSVKFEASVAHDWDVTPSIDIVPTPAKRGDILFADGTWGNPDDNPGKTPVALIFSTETSAADKALGFTNGYAIALKRIAMNGKYWAETGATAAGMEPSSQQMTDSFVPFGSTGWNGTTINGLAESMAPKSEVIGDMDGLTHCRTAYQRNGNSWSKLPAMAAAANCGFAKPSSGCSEWYLPSIGQLHKLYVNCGNLPEDHDWVNNGGSLWRGFYSYGEAYTDMMVNNMNSFFIKAGLSPSQYDKFTDGNSGMGGEEDLISSSEGTVGGVCNRYWYFYTNKQNGLCYDPKTTKFTGIKFVRPVIAF